MAILFFLLIIPHLLYTNEPSTLDLNSRPTLTLKEPHKISTVPRFINHTRMYNSTSVEDDLFFRAGCSFVAGTLIGPIALFTFHKFWSPVLLSVPLLTLTFYPGFTYYDKGSFLDFAEISTMRLSYNMLPYGVGIMGGIIVTAWTLLQFC